MLHKHLSESKVFAKPRDKTGDFSAYPDLDKNTIIGMLVACYDEGDIEKREAITDQMPRHLSDDFEYKDALIRKMTIVASVLSSPEEMQKFNITPAQKDIFLKRIFEEIGECTEGLFNRAQEVVDSFVRPNNIDELLVTYRVALVEEAFTEDEKRLSTNRDVHTHNRFMVVADTQLHLNVPCNKDDRYVHGWVHKDDEDIQDVISKTFEKGYKPSKITQQLLRSIIESMWENVLHHEDLLDRNAEYQRIVDYIKLVTQNERLTINDILLKNAQGFATGLNWAGINSAVIGAMQERGYFEQQEKEKTLTIQAPAHFPEALLRYLGGQEKSDEYIAKALEDYLKNLEDIEAKCYAGEVTRNDMNAAVEEANQVCKQLRIWMASDEREKDATFDKVIAVLKSDYRASDPLNETVTLHYDPDDLTETLVTIRYHDTTDDKMKTAKGFLFEDKKPNILDMLPAEFKDKVFDAFDKKVISQIGDMQPAAQQDLIALYVRFPDSKVAMKNLSDLLNVVVKAVASFLRIIRNMKVNERSIILEAMTDRIGAIVTKSTHVRDIMKLLDTNQQQTVYDKLKDKIPELINFGVDMSLAFTHLAPDQRQEIFDQIKDRITDIASDVSRFKYAIDKLNDEQRQFVFDRCKNQFSGWINQANDVQTLMSSLDDNQHQYVFDNNIKPLGDKLREFVARDTPDNAHRLLVCLSPEQIRVVCHIIKDNIIAEISNAWSIKALIGEKFGDSLNASQIHAVFDMLPEKLSWKLDEDDFISLLKKTDTDACRAICENLHKKVDNYDFLVFGVGRILNEQSLENGKVFCDVFGDKFPKFIGTNIRSVIACISGMDSEKAVLICETMHKHVPNIFKNHDDIVELISKVGDGITADTAKQILELWKDDIPKEILVTNCKKFEDKTRVHTHYEANHNTPQLSQPEQIALYFDLTKESLIKDIAIYTEFITLANRLNSEQRNELYDNLKEVLAEWTNSMDQFQRVSRLLNMDNLAHYCDAMSAKFPEIIASRHSLAMMTDFLDDDQIDLVFSKIYEKLPQMDGRGQLSVVNNNQSLKLSYDSNYLLGAKLDYTYTAGGEQKTLSCRLDSPDSNIQKIPRELLTDIIKEFHAMALNRADATPAAVLQVLDVCLHHLDGADRDDIIRNSIPKLTENGTKFNGLFSALSSVDKETVFNAIKDDLPSLVKSNLGFMDLLMSVPPDRKEEALKVCYGNFKELITDKWTLKTLLQIIPDSLKEEVYKDNKEHIQSMITNAGVLSELMEGLPETLQDEIFNDTKAKLPNMLCSIVSLASLLNKLDNENKNILFDAFKEKLSDLITNAADVCALIESLDNDREKIQIVMDAISEKRNDVFPDMESIIAVFENSGTLLLDETRHLIYTSLKDDIIEQSEDMQDVIYILGELSRPDVSDLLSSEEFLTKVTSYISDAEVLYLLQEDLDEDDFNLVLNGFGDNLGRLVQTPDHFIFMLHVHKDEENQAAFINQIRDKLPEIFPSFDSVVKAMDDFHSFRTLHSTLTPDFKREMTDRLFPYSLESLQAVKSAARDDCNSYLINNSLFTGRDTDPKDEWKSILLHAETNSNGPTAQALHAQITRPSAEPENVLRRSSGLAD